MRGKKKASKGEHGGEETWGWPGGVWYCWARCTKAGTPEGQRYLCSCLQGTQNQLVLPHFPTAALHLCCGVPSQHPPGPLLLLLQCRRMLTGRTTPTSCSNISKTERTYGFTQRLTHAFSGCCLILSTLKTKSICICEGGRLCEDRSDIWIQQPTAGTHFTSSRDRSGVKSYFPANNRA